MAIVVEKQDGRGGVRSGGEEEEEEEEGEGEGEEEDGEEVEEAERVVGVGGSRRDLQLLFHLPVGERSPQRPSVATSCSHSRSSSVTSWDSGSTSLTPDLSELGSKRYSATLDPEDLQQELVVKAIRVKKKTRRGRKGRTCLSVCCSVRTVHRGRTCLSAALSVCCSVPEQGCLSLSLRDIN